MTFFFWVLTIFPGFCKAFHRHFSFNHTIVSKVVVQGGNDSSPGFPSPLGNRVNSQPWESCLTSRNLFPCVENGCNNSTHFKEMLKGLNQIEYM